MEFQTETGRVFIEEDGKLLAEVLFPVKDGVADIEHTFVDDSLRGQGIAGQLIEKAAQQIRQSGLKAKATCSYAAKWLEKHAEYSDILKTDK